MSWSARSAHCGGALAHEIDNGALFTTAWILVQTVTLSLSAIFGTLLFFDLRARTALPWQGTPPVSGFEA